MANSKAVDRNGEANFLQFAAPTEEKRVPKSRSGDKDEKKNQVANTSEQVSHYHLDKVLRLAFKVECYSNWYRHRNVAPSLTANQMRYVV